MMVKFWTSRAFESVMISFEKKRNRRVFLTPVDTLDKALYVIVECQSNSSSIFFRYFLRSETKLKLRGFEWIFFIRNSWLRSSFSKWNTRLRLWYLPPVSLFNFKFSSVIKLCICFYIWLRRIVWVRCALVHDQLDGHSSREKVINIWSFMVRALIERYHTDNWTDEDMFVHINVTKASWLGLF